MHIVQLETRVAQLYEGGIDFIDHLAAHRGDRALRRGREMGGPISE